MQIHPRPRNARQAVEPESREGHQFRLEDPPPVVDIIQVLVKRSDEELQRDFKLRGSRGIRPADRHGDHARLLNVERIPVKASTRK